jgi:hypothetical protein
MLRGLGMGDTAARHRLVEQRAVQSLADGLLDHALRDDGKIVRRPGTFCDDAFCHELAEPSKSAIFKLTHYRTAVVPRIASLQILKSDPQIRSLNP